MQVIAVPMTKTQGWESHSSPLKQLFHTLVNNHRPLGSALRFFAYKMSNWVKKGNYTNDLKKLQRIFFENTTQKFTHFSRQTTLHTKSQNVYWHWELMQVFARNDIRCNDRTVWERFIVSGSSVRTSTRITEKPLNCGFFVYEENKIFVLPIIRQLKLTEISDDSVMKIYAWQ